MPCADCAPCYLRTMKETNLIPVHLGQTTYVQGYSFIVADIWSGESDGRQLYRYRGYCTADKRNDSILHTAYNGGVYGGLLNRG